MSFDLRTLKSKSIKATIWLWPDSDIIVNNTIPHWHIHPYSIDCVCEIWGIELGAKI